MSASKYKPGDIVWVRGDLKKNEEYDGWNATTDMAELAGEQVTIVSVENDILYGAHYKINESPWGWTDEMFSGFAISTAKCERSDHDTKEVEFTPGKIEELYSL